MMKDTCEIKLHPELRHATERLARERDISIGQLIRDVLSREIARATTAKPPVRADERLVAPLRARLAGDFAYADSWDSLQDRLRAKGYSLQAAGGGLALHDWPANRRICKASELGFSYSRLMRRLRAPFPGHSHTWLVERLGISTNTAPPDEEPDTLEVIERW